MMETVMDWFKGISQNWVADIITWFIIIGIPLILAWAKGKNWKYAQPAFYMIVSLALLSITYIAVTKIPYLADEIVEKIKIKSTDAKPQDIQNLVRKWLEVPHYRVKPVKTEKAFFQYEVMSDGKMFQVSMPKEPPKMLDFTVIVGLDQVALGQLTSLNKRQQNIVVSTLRTEFVQFKIAWANLELPLAQVALYHQLPFDNTISERVFRQAVSHLDGAIILFRQVIHREYARIQEMERYESSSTSP